MQDNSLTLIGTCYVYNRESLGYEILLCDGEETYTAQTQANGRFFKSEFDIIPQSLCEIKVRFNGYNSISAQTYIYDGEIQYVKNAPEPDIIGTDLERVVFAGDLMCYQPEYDTFVYQVNNKLYWLIGKPFEGSLILHYYTDEPEKLPENRIPYGFDNKSFVGDSYRNITSSLNCGKYTVFIETLPQSYRISAVKVGMNKGKRVLWEEYFRISKNGLVT